MMFWLDEFGGLLRGPDERGFYESLRWLACVNAWDWLPVGKLDARDLYTIGDEAAVKLLKEYKADIGAQT